MKNVFVFPCGSEIALEIERSLRYSTHFYLIGGGSVKDHGQFVFDDRVDNLPWESDPSFIPTVKRIVQERKIDLIFPAMDSSIVRLKSAENELQCKVVGSSLETTQICLSKKATYKKLSEKVLTPKLYSAENIANFPVFCKPEVGYGSRGAAKITNQDELLAHLKKHPNTLICEYLPGAEYTVDCFTDRHGNLRFCGPRVRARIMNGISVNTYPVAISEKEEFEKIAEIINQEIKFRGAWFFQVKRNSNGELCLLEIAARFGGSSSLFRGQGINFAELTLWDALDYDIVIEQNRYDIEMDRALDNRFKIEIDYNEVFVDFDDTLILEKKYYNAELMHFLFQCKNNKKKITLLSRHDGDLLSELKRLHLDTFFDRVIHLASQGLKSTYIDNLKSIMIDDSFAERKEVADKTNIPVFSPNMVYMLIK